MRTLYHHTLCPFSRKVRLVLAEKKLEFEPCFEQPWDRRDAFVALNPASEVPVLVQTDGTVFSDSTAICEYLDETVRDPALLPDDLLEKAEVRRLVGWFDAKFHREVTVGLLGEKVIKRLSQSRAEPDSRLIRAGFSAIHEHLDYIAWLTERRTWLAGADFSLADISAAAQLSCIDYMGDVPWDRHPGAKDWYARIKSRPSFRAIRADHLPGVTPAKHYSDVDF